MTLRSTLVATGLLAAISLGTSALAFAHGPGTGSGNPYGGWYYGCGMGPGMMGPGMMQPLPDDLSAAQVKHMLAHRLAWQGNPNVKVGSVQEKDDDTIVAEIVTQDGSLVQKFDVDRHTGWMRPAR